MRDKLVSLKCTLSTRVVEYQTTTTKTQKNIYAALAACEELQIHANSAAAGSTDAILCFLSAASRAVAILQPGNVWRKFKIEPAEEFLQRKNAYSELLDELFEDWRAITRSLEKSKK